MKQLAIIEFSNPSAKRIKNLYVRKSARALVFDNENKIALLHVSRQNYHKLPGGGAKKNENILKALRREVLEETGCQIKIGPKVGKTTEYKIKINQKHISTCYITYLKGDKGNPSFTNLEKKDGFNLKWVTLSQALKLMTKDKPKDYHGKFICARDPIYLKEAKELYKKK